ncbi:hypothetical protein GCM10023149_13480 [Mucilaginibacter gynuensis]|uniref:Uncharacterized protein n=1 Tax=Mucilaginibacter gynuensis TaxID=1302236 RepID=A0ABP8G3D6_9SPHI
MQNTHYIKFYRVFKNGTSVTEIHSNDFKPTITKNFKRGWLIGPPVDVLCSIPYSEYSLPADETMYYGYTDKITAMEKAKTGAIVHVNQLIKNAEQAILKLKQYRIDNYEGLNLSLVDTNIRRLEKEMNIK